jgi:hypothetical protein
MKTKHFITVLALLVAGGFAIDASAQTHLKALVKKCESIESVDMNIVRHRNSETKELKRTITSILIKDNEALVNEFMAAFKADEGDATQIIEHKRKGETTPSFYRFEKVNYSFSLKDKANASVTEFEGDTGRVNFKSGRQRPPRKAEVVPPVPPIPLEK